MLKLSIESENIADFRAKVSAAAAIFASASPAAITAATDTKAAGKSKAGTKATTTDADEAARAAGSSATVVAGKTVDAVVEEEDDGLDDGPTVTKDEVKPFLVELKANDGFAKNGMTLAKFISSVCGEGVNKLADVSEDKLTALMAATKKKLGELGA
jgi:hypothetical protein